MRIINVVLPLILIILFGFTASRKKLITEDFAQEGSKSVFTMFLPISMFVSVYGTAGTEVISYKVMTSIILISIFMIAIFLAALKKMNFDNEEIAILMLAIFRSNILLFGLPLAENYYGKEEVDLITMYIGAVSIFANILAVMNFEILTNDKFDLKKLLKSVSGNPILIAIFSALILKNLKIALPNVFIKAMKDIGKIATPLGLMCIGAMIRFKKDRHENKIIYTGILGRGLILPFIGVALAVLLGIRGKELFVIVITFAAPEAVSNHAMSVIYTSKGEIAGKLVMYITIFNSLTIFVLLYILTMLGYL